MERGEVLKISGIGDALRVLTIDRLDAEQREVSLRLLGRADLSLHHVAVSQAEPANLAGADVDVVGAWEVVVLRAAEEPEPVGKDFQYAFAVHQAVLANPAAQDLEDQVLLLKPDVILNAFLTSDLVQTMDIHRLQILDIQLSALHLLVLGIRLSVETADILRLRRGGLFAPLFPFRRRTGSMRGG